MAYVYRHIRLDKNEPFYIGIGNKKNYARAYEKCKRNQLWRNIVNKTQYDVEILVDDIEWELACEKEIEFIKLYGRIDNNTGTLSNLTDGGDGRTGWFMPEEAKEKLRIINTGKFVSEETRAKMKLSNLGRKASEETRAKMSKSHKGKKRIISEEARERWILYLKNKKLTPEQKHNISKAKTGSRHSEETKEKMSKSHMGMRNRCKKVMCLTTGEIFASQVDAAKAFNVKRKTICRQMTGFSKNKYNLVFIK